MSFILSRLAFETIVTIRFLIQHFSPALIDSYVRHSLRHERRLRDLIQANIKKRGGEITPIETRMLNSIDRTSRIAGISLDTVDPKERGNWGNKNIYEKVEAVGLREAYLGVFGGPSHSVHGSWQDLYEYHLEATTDGRFTPKLDWRRPRPQVLLALASLVVETVAAFFEFIAGAEGSEELRTGLRDLAERIQIADDAHEQYLAGRKWPST